MKEEVAGILVGLAILAFIALLAYLFTAAFGPGPLAGTMAGFR